MKPWDYASNPKWLEARKGLLTATEIAELIEPYKEWQASEALKANGDGRAKPESKKETFRIACRKLWAAKRAETVMKNADTAEMRRGHCLEPYAVEAVNQLGGSFYHWDDIVVTNGMFGCSPDALDIPMPKFAIEDCVCDISDISPKHALEIKSLNPVDHMAEYELTDKWMIDKVRKNSKIIQQVAGQIVSLGLEDCTVVFFNPQLKRWGVKMFTFTSKDFEEEAKLFQKVVEAYGKFVDEFENIPESDVTIPWTEQELYDIFLGGKEYE